MEAYLTITNNCNLKCPHCCYNSGPGKADMPFEEIKSVINNLPENLKEIWLSGGEAFTRKKLLYDALEYIQNKKFEHLSSVVVQTNGFWAINDEKTNGTLEELLKLGVTGVHVASNDAHHKRAGMDMSKTRRLMKLAGKKDMNRSYEYNPNLSVVPVGRAKFLDKKYWGYWGREPFVPSCLELEKIPSVCISYNGLAYACGWMVPGTELGDAREEEVAKIVKRSLENEIISMLIQKNGPKKLARKAGMCREDIDKFKKRGPCGLCVHLFSEELITLE